MNYLIVAVLCLALSLVLTLGAAATALSDLGRAPARLARSAHG